MRESVLRQSPHGRDVADIDHQGFPAQLKERSIGKIKVNVFHQGVHGPQEAIAAGKGDGGAVVADADNDLGRGGAELLGQGRNQPGFTKKVIFLRVHIRFEKSKFKDINFVQRRPVTPGS